MDSVTYTTDTSPGARKAQLAGLRNMTPQQRIRQTCAMSRQVKRMAFAAIRRRHPGLTENEVQLRFIELTFGAALSDAVRIWQREHCD